MRQPMNSPAIGDGSSIRISPNAAVPASTAKRRAQGDAPTHLPGPAPCAYPSRLLQKRKLLQDDKDLPTPLDTGAT
jgi:hypothetical protein